MRLVLLIFVMLVPVSAGAFCFEEAGLEFNVPPVLLWAIAKVESDFDPRAVNTNKNSIDVGLMQINSEWRESLGPEVWDGLFNPCLNVRVGAWVLADCLYRYGYTWEGIGCYNASSPEKRRVYAKKIVAVLETIKSDTTETPDEPQLAATTDPR